MTPDPDVAAVGLVWTQPPTASPVHVVGPRAAADVGPNAYESMKGTLSIKQTRGRAPSRADEVAVGRALLDQLGAQVGDQITATSSKTTMQLTIVGDNLDPGVDVAGNGFAMTLDGLVALTDPIIGGTVVRFAPGTDHAALLDRYSALDLTPVVPPSEVGHIGQLGGLPGRVGQLLTLLGVAALLNSIVLTVRAARREIALHRALGFTNAQVVGVHLWQGAITAFTGVVIGGSVGFVVARSIDRQLVGNVGAIAQTVLPSVVWLVAVGTIGVCLCAGVIASATALRHSPGFVLRAE
jgi:putative ABC transport system permease protein